jgi:hypothetical protein
MPGLDPGIHHLQSRLPSFRWIAGSSSVKTRFALLPSNNEMEEREPRMQSGLAKHVIALLLAAPLLAGCLERGQPTMVDTSADDDAFCRANNVAVGSNDYVNCRKNRDVQRGNANARTDRAQRNLAEQMLNNPTRP